MWKCGNYNSDNSEFPTDCYYQDDRCCFYCDRRKACTATAQCYFICYDDDDDNPDGMNAYWVDMDV